MSKLITVFGATGKQGNSVVLALLAKGYKVRALTRSLDSKGAKKLQELEGCEAVKVDLDNRESLEKVIAGSGGVFAVTNFWGLLAENPETAFDREISQGKAIGDVCKKEGVKLLVYSGLEHVQAIIGKNCPHFDSKGIVEKYLDEIQVPNTSTRMPFYYENFLSSAQKGEGGTYSMTWPMNGAMDAMSVDDLGGVVVAIFNNPGQYLGKKVGLSGDRMSMFEYTDILSEVTGKTIKYNQVPVEVFAKFPFPGAEDTATMFEFYEVGKPVRDAALTRTLNPNTATFKVWAQKNKETFEFQ